MEARFLLGITVFFGIIAICYWLTSYEDGGTFMLIGTACLGVLPGSYYYFWHRRFQGSRFFFWGKLDRVVGTRPEDRSDATIAEGAGVISAFPGSSVWPFIFGVGAFSFLFAFVFGTWLALIGISVIFVSIIGFTAESRRGGQH